MAVKGPFKVEFADVFPFGAGVVGDVVPVRDFDRSTPERPVQQRDKEDPRLLFWQVDVMDFDPEAREKVVRVKILAPHQPVPPAAVQGLPIRPVVLEGLTVTPYVKEQGTFSKVAYSLRATELAPAQRPTGPSGKPNTDAKVA